MKNVTIALQEEVAGWARVEAAKAGKSLSRYLADLLAERMRSAAEDRYSGLRRWLDQPPWPSAAGPLPKREEIYAEREDELLLRYERARRRGRPKQLRKEGMAHRSHRS